MAFSDRLRNTRIAKGYNSQAALAAKLGISSGTIGNYESGVRPKPERKFIDKIAECLNIPAADLADGPELSQAQYLAFAARLSDALDHTSSDDFEALGLSEREIRTALQQKAPIREDRAVYLAEALGTKIDDILAERPTPEEVDRERRFEAYLKQIIARSTKVDERDLEDIMDYIEYKVRFKGDKLVITKNKEE